MRARTCVTAYLLSTVIVMMLQMLVDLGLVTTADSPLSTGECGCDLFIVQLTCAIFPGLAFYCNNSFILYTQLYLPYCTRIPHIYCSCSILLSLTIPLIIHIYFFIWFLITCYSHWQPKHLFSILISCYYSGLSKKDETQRERHVVVMS